MSDINDEAKNPAAEEPVYDDMKARVCPKCRNNIIMDKMAVRDIVLDVCPQCRGVFYDRGELKKILPQALDAETILSRMSSDGSDLSCPRCKIGMDRVSAKKESFSYELFFCRKCLATFLPQEQLQIIKRRISSTQFKPPSVMRPKAVMPTMVSSAPPPPVAIQKPPSAPEKDYSKFIPGSAPAAPPATPPQTPPPAPPIYRRPSPIDQVHQRLSAIPGAAAPVHQYRIAGSDEIGDTALEHYSHMNYDDASEAENISAPVYLFCILSNLPVEVYNPRVYFPTVLAGIIAVNFLIFLYSFDLITSAAYRESALMKLREFNCAFGMIPIEYGGLKFLFNLFTYQFLHGGISHIVFNMYFLWIFGDNVCDIFYDFKNPIRREVSFLTFYLFTGVVAGFAHAVGYWGAVTPIIGASGAVSGVMGAYIRLFPGSRFYQVIFFYPFKIPSYFYIGFWILGQMLLAMSLGSSSSTSWAAHLGGFAVGYATIGYFIPHRIEEINPPSRLY